MHLTQPDNQEVFGKDKDFVGPWMDPHLARGIAEGFVCPKTKLPFDPDHHLYKNIHTNFMIDSASKEAIDLTGSDDNDTTCDVIVRDTSKVPIGENNNVVVRDATKLPIMENNENTEAINCQRRKRLHPSTVEVVQSSTKSKFFASSPGSVFSSPIDERKSGEALSPKRKSVFSNVPLPGGKRNKPEVVIRRALSHTRLTFNESTVKHVLDGASREAREDESPDTKIFRKILAEHGNTSTPSNKEGRSTFFETQPQGNPISAGKVDAGESIPRQGGEEAREPAEIQSRFRKFGKTKLGLKGRKSLAFK